MERKWRAIEAISYFGNDIIKPIKIRFQENGEYVVLNIEQIISVEKRYTAGYITYFYECESVVNNCLKNVTIRFISDDNLWEMRMI